MQFVGLLSWWYSAGWRRAGTSSLAGLARVYDYFSIDLLARTLFSPFRQISAGGVSGPLVAQFRQFIDRLISRFIGAFMRTLVMVVGILALFITITYGLLKLVVWPVLPVLPLVFAYFSAVGWVPWMI